MQKSQPTAARYPWFGPQEPDVLSVIADAFPNPKYTLASSLRLEGAKTAGRIDDTGPNWSGNTSAANVFLFKMGRSEGQWCDNA